MADGEVPDRNELPSVAGISFSPSRREWLYAWDFGEPGIPLDEALTRGSQDERTE
ncbi:hypothetical protein ACNQR7_31635 [Mycolicibacterium senegalense]|uniref:hypothetical protein n=1 Tax=Mycobacteriaceae TaxID=1762 RepID=UPI003AAC8BD5